MCNGRRESFRPGLRTVLSGMTLPRKYGVNTRWTPIREPQPALTPSPRKMQGCPGKVRGVNRNVAVHAPYNEMFLV